MIVGAIILGLITLVLGILTQWAIKHRSGNMSYGVFMGTIITLFFTLEVWIVSDIIEKPELTAIDLLKRYHKAYTRLVNALEGNY